MTPLLAPVAAARSLRSGVLPRPGRDASVQPAGLPELPDELVGLVNCAPVASLGWWDPGSSVMSDPDGVVATAVRVTRGALVVSGDPVAASGRARRRAGDQLLDDCITLARSGGRIPLATGVSEDMCGRWVVRGFQAEERGASISAPMSSLDESALTGTPAGDRVAELAADGVQVEILPARWIPNLIHELSFMWPELDTSRLEGRVAMVCRHQGRVIGVGSLWDRGESAIALHMIFRVRPPRGLPVMIFGRAARWCREHGVRRLSVEVHGRRLHRSDVEALGTMGATVSPRYDVRPRGIAGWVAARMALG
jgi:hypothetical protein